MSLKTTAQGMNGGMDGAAGRGMNYTATVTGTWAEADTITFTLTDALTALQTTIGAGTVTNIGLNYVLTFADKVYGLAGSTCYFSAVGTAKTWNDTNAAGNGFITMSNNFGISEDLQAAGVYQGKLAIISRRTTQIWSMDADPALNTQSQVLTNIGTVAKLSVQGIGDSDLYMLGDSGFRSVRVRDASNNASVAFIGEPVDALVQTALEGMTEAQKAAACGTVEPSAMRYWCYLPGGSIWVFSSFPSSEVAAWSQYTPTYSKGERLVQTIMPPNAGLPRYTGGGSLGGVVYFATTYNTLVAGHTYLWTKGVNETAIVNGSTTLRQTGTFVAASGVAAVYGPAAVGYVSPPGQFWPDLTCTLVDITAQSPTPTSYTKTAFTPELFAVYQGKVYVRAGDNIFLYGGLAGTTYDACGVTVRTPYLDCDTPATGKDFFALDAAIEGTWAVGISSDYAAETFKNVFNGAASTFKNSRVAFNRRSSHLALQLDESGSAYARLSSVMIHFKPGADR